MTTPPAHSTEEISVIEAQTRTAPAVPDILTGVIASLDDDKAEGVVSIPLAGKSSIADHMVIASGTSARHVGAMAQHLQERLKKSGVKGIAIEGMPACDWVLIDAGDVIVHVFRPEVRDFYNLERMWLADLPREEDVVAG